MITVEQLHTLATQLNITIEETPLGDTLGYYDAIEHLIVLDSTLSRLDYKCTLAHELIHATLHDDTCISSIASSKQEQRARRITARLLIADTDYAIAEAMYDTNTVLIARELDVTQSILTDYQQLLQEQPQYSILQ